MSHAIQPIPESCVAKEIPLPFAELLHQLQAMAEDLASGNAHQLELRCRGIEQISAQIRQFIWPPREVPNGNHPRMQLQKLLPVLQQRTLCLALLRRWRRSLAVRRTLLRYDQDDSYTPVIIPEDV